MPAHGPEVQKGVGGAALSATACVVCAHHRLGRTGHSYTRQVWWALQKLTSQLLRSAVNFGGIQCVVFRNGDSAQALLAGSLCKAIKDQRSQGGLMLPI